MLCLVNKISSVVVGLDFDVFINTGYNPLLRVLVIFWVSFISSQNIYQIVGQHVNFHYRNQLNLVVFCS